jgi:hypothetical protein
MASAQNADHNDTDKRSHMTDNQRLENQSDHILAGTKDHQLTRAERTNLSADDAAVRAQEKVCRQANDGQARKKRETSVRLGAEPKQPPDSPRSAQRSDAKSLHDPRDPRDRLGVPRSSRCLTHAVRAWQNGAR